MVSDYSASYSASSNELTIGDSANNLLDNECVTSDSAIECMQVMLHMRCLTQTCGKRLWHLYSGA